MSESRMSNVGEDLIRVHMVITRSLRIAIEYSHLFLQFGIPDVVMYKGFSNYVQSLTSVLHAHHLSEDELGFPFLRIKLPGAPYDILTAQHLEIMSKLVGINQILEDMKKDNNRKESLIRLNHILKDLSDLWLPHIRIEEEYFSVREMGQLLDQDEQIRLSGMLSEHNRNHAGPDYLVIPFFLYNLPGEERKIFAQTLPPAVTQELVPGLWREKWEPMMPFLLP